MLNNRLLKRYKSSPTSSRKLDAVSNLNRFFDKIFVINLKASEDRWKKVSKRFKEKGIEVDRYNAIDGRCKTEKQCESKAKTFSKRYNIVYSKKIKNPMERLPASSLTLSHKLIYNEMINRGWSQILICEDDILIDKNIERIFKKGISELPPDWDMLYLGCGSECGNSGLGYNKTKKHKFKSDIAKFFDINWYVTKKEDLRVPCDYCEKISDTLTIPTFPGGTWSFAVSLKGAKKLNKIIGKNIGRHCDKIYSKYISENKLNAYAFDPPIMWHEEGAFRKNTTIPWTW